MMRLALCLFGVVAANALLHSQDIAHCDAPIGSFRRCVLRDGNWEHRVYIENGIRTDVALELLVAIRDGRIINKAQAPTLPELHVSRVWQIRQGSMKDSAPHEFEIKTLERPAQPKGLSFLVNLRKQSIEVVAYAFWIA